MLLCNGRRFKTYADANEYAGRVFRQTGVVLGIESAPLRRVAKVRHANGKPDSRYSVRLEFCGYASARYVARFCGEWLGQDETRAGAVAIAQTHNVAHCAALGIPNGQES